MRRDIQLVKFFNNTVAIVLSIFICSPSYAQVTCDVFDIQYKFADKNLYVSLKTDLPDDTVVIISISRSYWEKGNPDEYSIDYFSEETTVEEWRKEHDLLLDNSKWKADLENKQKELASLDLGFDVDKISDSVSVSAIVPMNQSSSTFGDKNSKLTGKKVNTSGFRIVEDEVTIQYPLEGGISKKSKFGEPLSLKPGETYSVSRITPLMPELSPSDPMTALENVKYIQEGDLIKIISVSKKDNQPWYKVEAINNNQAIGEGWINSTALIGQQLYIKE